MCMLTTQLTHSAIIMLKDMTTLGGCCENALPLQAYSGTVPGDGPTLALFAAYITATSAVSKAKLLNI